MVAPQGPQVNVAQFDWNKISGYVKIGIPVIFMVISHWVNSGNIGDLQKRVTTMENKGVSVSDVTGAVSDVESMFHAKRPGQGARGKGK